MPLSRSLLLKGLAGASAVTAGGLGIGYRENIGSLFKSQNQINEENAEKENKEKIIERVKNLLPEDCHLENNSFTDSTTFSKDCSLDEDKFQKIKFFDGGDEVTVDGFNGGNTVSLNISNKGENGIKVLFKNPSSNLTIFSGSKPKVTIRSNKETEFEEENGRLVKVVDQTLKTKLEGINKRLVTLVLPENCGFDVTEKDESIECPLSSEALRKIVFSNRGTGDVTLKDSVTVPENLKIKVERKEENISFSFTGLSEDLTIYGDKSKGKIVLKGESKFKDVNGRLTKGTPDEALKTLNEQLGTVNAPLECRFDEAESDASVECDITEDEFKGLEFSNKGEGDLTVKTWPTSGNVKLKAEKKQDNSMSVSFTGLGQNLTIYGDKSEGKIVLKNSETKFSVQNGKLTKGASDADLKKFNKQLGTINAPIECRFDEAESDASVECNISEAEFKALEFSNKGTGELTVKTWPDSGAENIKLKVDKEQDNSMSVSFTGVTSDIKVFGDKGKMVIKNSSETKFKVIDDKLTKENSDAEIKKFNEQLGKVNVPVECRFDEAESDTTAECTVSKEDLKKMVFTKEKGDLTYSEGEGFQNMKLGIGFNVEEVASDESEIKRENKVMHLTFKGYDKTVKLSKGGQEIVSFIKNTNPEFVVGKNDDVHVLEKKWKPTSFLGLLGLQCEETTPEECTSTTGTINVSKEGREEFEALNISNTYKKFVLHKDQEGFNQGYKFVFKQGNVRNNSTGVCLEQSGKYEFKWKIQDKGKVGYLSKKN